MAVSSHNSGQDSEFQKMSSPQPADSLAIAGNQKEVAITSTKFTLFPRLPIELRYMIWENSMEDPRMLLIWEDHTMCQAFTACSPWDPRLVYCQHTGRCPGAFHACRESKTVGLRLFSVSRSTTTPPRPGPAPYPFIASLSAQMFNPELDILLVTPSKLFRNPEDGRLLQTANLAIFDGPWSTPYPWQMPRFPDSWQVPARFGVASSCHTLLADWYSSERERPSVGRAMASCTIFMLDDIRCHSVELGNGPLPLTLEACGLSVPADFKGLGHGLWWSCTDAPMEGRVQVYYCHIEKAQAVIRASPTTSALGNSVFGGDVVQAGFAS